MENIIRKIINNVLTALYQPFGAAVLLAFVAMFVFIYAKEHNWHKKDIIKNICSIWFSDFKKSCEFRKVFFAYFLFSDDFIKNSFVQGYLGESVKRCYGWLGFI